MYLRVHEMFWPLGLGWQWRREEEAVFVRGVAVLPVNPGQRQPGRGPAGRSRPSSFPEQPQWKH